MKLRTPLPLLPKAKECPTAHQTTAATHESSKFCHRHEALAQDASRRRSYLEEDVYRVLFSNRPCFEHCKTALHKKHEEGPNERPENIQVLFQ